MERHILREGSSSCPIFSSLSQGVPTFAPPCKPYRQRRPRRLWSLRISGSTLDSDWTDSLNLTAWFSYHVVSFRFHTCSTGLPRRTAIPLFTNHNVTAGQSTRGQQERDPNPCQRSLYNIIFLSHKKTRTYQSRRDFFTPTHTHTHTHTHTYIYIYIYILSSTDRQFCCITTLEILQANYL